MNPQHEVECFEIVICSRFSGEGSQESGLMHRSLRMRQNVLKLRFVLGSAGESWCVYTLVLDF